MTPEEREMHREKARNYQRSRYANNEALRRKKIESKRLRLANMTPQQREKYREMDRLRHQRNKAANSLLSLNQSFGFNNPIDKLLSQQYNELSLIDNLLADQYAQLAAETPKRLRIADMTPEQYREYQRKWYASNEAFRRRKMVNKRSRIANMTPKQLEEYREKERSYANKRYEKRKAANSLLSLSSKFGFSTKSAQLAAETPPLFTIKQRKKRSSKPRSYKK